MSSHSGIYGRGFTLIELVVTLALVAALSTLVLPMQELVVKRGKESDLRSALRQIREALDSYRQAVDDGRIATTTGASGYPKSLKVLVDGIADARSPSGTTVHFLRRIPRDPFADGRLQSDATWGQRSYQSDHANPQRGEDVYDVYSLSNDIGLNGVPYRQW